MGKCPHGIFGPRSFGSSIEKVFRKEPLCGHGFGSAAQSNMRS